MTDQIGELRDLLATLRLRVADCAKKKLLRRPVVTNFVNDNSGAAATNIAPAHPASPNVSTPISSPPKTPISGPILPPPRANGSDSQTRNEAVTNQQRAPEPLGTKQTSSKGLISSLWSRFRDSASRFLTKHSK